MADQQLFSQLRALDLNGDPIAGALLRAYVVGTTTPKLIYTSTAATTVHPVPLEADGNGIFPQVFADGQVKIVITDADGGTVPGGTFDPAGYSPMTGSSAALISFAPTATIPETNVADAIASVYASIATSINAAGFGVTGDGVRLSNFDSLVIPSGAFRFDAATTGTRPTGWSTLLGTGIFIRETAARGMMIAIPRNNDDVAIRRLDVTWQPWVKVAHDGRIATQAQAIAGTAEDVYMNPLRVAQAIAALAPSAVGAVGTYAYLSSKVAIAPDTTWAEPGATKAGADLVYAGYHATATTSASETNASNPVVSATSPAGTWRCMGLARNGFLSGDRHVHTLWYRIS